MCLWLPMPVHECARVHVDVLHNVHAFMRVLSVCVCVCAVVHFTDAHTSINIHLSAN